MYVAVGFSYYSRLYYSTYRVVMVLVSGVAAAAVVVDHFIFIPNTTTNPSSNDSRAQCREINGECICCEMCKHYCTIAVPLAGL